jgi:hypothetical protein
VTAYELPIGTEITIGKRRWRLSRRMATHPDIMRFLEVTPQEPDPIGRPMYPSEVDALINAGFTIRPPEVSVG